VNDFTADQLPRRWHLIHPKPFQMHWSNLMTRHRQDRPSRVTVDSLFGEQYFVSTSPKEAQVAPESSTGYGTPTAFPAIESPLAANDALACWKARD
jgi:hypothetical protein